MFCVCRILYIHAVYFMKHNAVEWKTNYIKTHSSITINNVDVYKELHLVLSFADFQLFCITFLPFVSAHSLSLCFVICRSLSLLSCSNSMSFGSFYSIFLVSSVFSSFYHTIFTNNLINIV